MSLNIGRKGWIGIGKETSPGVPVAISDYVPFTENTLKPMHEPIPNEAAYGVREKTFDASLGKKWSEGDISINCDSDDVGFFLLGALGTDTPANVAGSVYDHVITRNNSNTPQTFTVTMDRGVDRQYYRSIAVKSLEFSVSDALVEAKASLIGKFPVTTASGTLTTASGGLYSFGDARFAFGATVAGAASAANLKPHDMKLKIENNTVATFRHGSYEPDTIDHGEFEATAEGSVYFESTTERDNYYNLDKQAASFKMTGQGLGGGYSSSLEFRMYRTHFETFELETGLSDFYAEKFTIRCDYDNANSKSIDAVLRNVRASY
jgi:hypothetical protein